MIGTKIHEQQDTRKSHQCVHLSWSDRVLMIRAEWAAGRVMHGEQSCWIGPEGKCFLNSSWAINCQLELYFGKTFDSQTLARNEHSIICSSRYDPEAIATCVLAIASCKERCKESKEYKVLERHLNIIDVLAKLTAMTIWEENVGQEQKTYGVWEKKRLGDASSLPTQWLMAQGARSLAVQWAQEEN